MSEAKAFVNGEWVGEWVEAEQLKYQPSLRERILHYFGVHQWTFVEPKKCVICNEERK
jgi:hypothetical protein